MSCDNLLSAQVVIADGTVHTASASENEDLFWALRGGGGNFGVVTSFEYQLHPVDMVHAGVIFYSIDDARAVAEFYREHLANAPEEFSAFLGFHLCPVAPYLPPERQGKPVCVVAGIWIGDPAEGEARWQPYLDIAPVVGSLVQRMPYPEVNTVFGEGLRLRSNASARRRRRSRTGTRVTDNFRSNYDRLATIKAKFDPENLFHLNQNIKPVAPKFSTFHDADSVSAPSDANG